MKWRILFKYHRAVVTTSLLVNLFNNVEAKKYLGLKFDAASFALCQQYGCKFLSKMTWEGGPFGPGTHLDFQLKSYDAKLGVDLRYPEFIAGLWIKFLRYPLDANDEILADGFINSASGYKYKTGLVSKCLDKASRNLSEEIIFASQFIGAKCEVKRYRNSYSSSIFIFFAD